MAFEKLCDTNLTIKLQWSCSCCSSSPTTQLNYPLVGSAPLERRATLVVMLTRRRSIRRTLLGGGELGAGQSMVIRSVLAVTRPPRGHPPLPSCNPPESPGPEFWTKIGARKSLLQYLFQGRGECSEILPYRIFLPSLPAESYPALLPQR